MKTGKVQRRKMRKGDSVLIITKTGFQYTGLISDDSSAKRLNDLETLNSSFVYLHNTDIVTSAGSLIAGIHQYSESNARIACSSIESATDIESSQD